VSPITVLTPVAARVSAVRSAGVIVCALIVFLLLIGIRSCGGLQN
jgi:hypothetical protein